MTPPPTLYSTWRQTGTTPIYFVVWSVNINSGEVQGYTLLRLFNPSFTEISKAKFQELVDKKAFVEWKG